jgi:maltose alpha-D-glucosyltransferase/alpha-amylase
VLKLFRRLDGINPDLEIGRFLRRGFAEPALAAGLGNVDRREPTTLAMIQGTFTPGGRGQYTPRGLKRFFERVVTKRDWGSFPPPNRWSICSTTSRRGSRCKDDRRDRRREASSGRRTGELHPALAGGPENLDFATEPYSALYQRSMYQSMRNVSGKVFRLPKARSGDVAARGARSCTAASRTTTTWSPSSKTL